MASVVDARQRSAVCVMENGTEIRTAPKIRKPMRFSKLPSRLDGRDVTAAELW